MSYKGDFAVGSTIYGKFTTRRDTGLPTTLADALSGSPSTPELHVYKDNSTTQSAVGITLTIDFDSITGLNHYTIDTSQDGAFYSAGSDFSVVISRGSVNSINVAGELVFEFSLANRSHIPLFTTVNTKLDTIDDFLDTEIAAIKAKTDNLPTDPADASDIAASFTTVNTKLDTIDDFLDTEIAAILTDTNELQTDWADGGRLDLILDARASQTSIDTIDDFVDTEVAAIKVVTDKLATMLEEDSGSPTTWQFTSEAVDQVSGGSLTLADIADAVWDEPIAGHLTAGTTGATLNSKASQTSVDTIDDFLDTEIAAIKAKTDNLPVSPAATGDIPSAASIASTVWATVIENSTSALSMMRGYAAALLGKASGMATTTAVFRDTGDSKNRITATVDADGNRSAVTLDLT